MIFLIHPSVHLRTRSIDFFLELFPDGELRCFHDDSWKNDRDFSSVKHVMFLQIFPDLMDVHFLKGKSVTIVPMYDAVLSMHDVQWWEYRHFKTVSFCEALTRKLKGLGMEVFPIKFFPPVPAESMHSTERPLRIFFWRRGFRPDITMVLEMLPDEAPVQLLYRSDVDDSIPPLPPNVSLIPLPWFPSRKEYLAEVASCDLYVAPREAEGIGLSFLEALACGVPVLAMNAPTMNEYVHHGRNGFLFGQPTGPLTRDVLGQMRADVRARGIRWREQFELGIPSLLEYLLQKPGPDPTRRDIGFEIIILFKRLARRIKAAAQRVWKR